jgi:simple sugar transport system permease protein/D-xylose transport system permease protein
MTQTASAPLDRLDERLEQPTGFSGQLRSTLRRVRSGDLGSLPIVIGLVLIAIIFQTLNSNFLSARNITNLLLETAAVGVIALGVVLVLLVAQIDLSVGSMSGVASAILGVALTQQGWPLAAAISLALAMGLGVGLLYGFIFVRFSVPSFVVTLAGLLALLGLQLRILNTNGSINIDFESPIVKFMQQWFLPDWLSYVLAVALSSGYALNQLSRIRRRRRMELSSASPTGVLIRAGVLLLGLLVACWYVNTARGIGLSFVLLVLLVMIMHFALTRTHWGRSVYAVGGNVEAARRAGINVNRVYISVFALCSLLAAVGGLLAAGRLATASISSGTGDTNLNAIAAAVIGGTSLFGGRGSAYSALLGVFVIASISSGLTLLSLPASTRFMITGGVLLLAVIIDSLSRRSRVAHGGA